MSRYDEDTIVALLHDAVPPVPDELDRVELIKHRAGRQRATLWTQALGAVASVLLVVGVAAAVSNAGGSPAVVRPVSNPLDVLGEALVNLTSVRFEASMQPVGKPDPRGLQVSAEQLEDMLTSHVSGALAANGDFEVSGDLSILDSFSLGEELSTGDLAFKAVDGVSYRSVLKYDEAPAGKKWVRESDDPGGKDDLVAELLLLKRFGDDVRYVGNTTVRGEAVAEYAFTVPKGLIPAKIDVTFALDARNRLRRATAQGSWRDLFQTGDDAVRNAGMDPLLVRVELLAYGYGDRVSVDAPPAREVIDEGDLEQTVSPVGDSELSAAFEQCSEQSKTTGGGIDVAKYRECMTRVAGPGAGSDVVFGTMAPVPPVP